jgi:hypothetical protein
MSKFKIAVAVVVLATALTAAALAEPPKGGGARGGGGAAHIGGGGGGGAPHINAAPAMSRSAAPAMSRSAAPTMSRSAGPAISRSSAQPSFRSSAGPGVRGNVSHSTSRTTFRGAGPSGVRNVSRTSVNRGAVVNSSPSSVRNANRGTTRNTNLNATRNTNLGATRDTNLRTTRDKNLNASVRSNAVRNALGSRSVAGVMHDRGALRNPGNRAGITASAAIAGWRQGHGGEHGWWRHRNGGYGWVGPLFWPFAYNDVYGYAMWGGDTDPSFWGYGYDDIYAGVFAPYAYDDLAGYLPQSGLTLANVPSTNALAPAQPLSAPAAPTADTGQLAQMCGDDSRDIAGLPIDQIEQALAPNEAQRAALAALADASVAAANDIKTACPTDVALTAPSRLARMQKRIEAMIAAVGTVQPPLEEFYGLLSDEQKQRLTALGQDQRQAQAATKTAGPLAQGCGAAQPGVTAWPTAEIDRTVLPTAAQRPSLVALQTATAKAADMLAASCQADESLTPPARLAAVGKRLDTMLQAVKTVRSALDDFYGRLNDEQKARFEAIGPARMSQADAPAAKQTRYRGRGNRGVESVIRQLLRSF